jgi:hypothetical protein
MKYGVIEKEDSFNKKVATQHISDAMDLGLVILKNLKNGNPSICRTFLALLTKQTNCGTKFLNAQSLILK